MLESTVSESKKNRLGNELAHTDVPHCFLAVPHGDTHGKTSFKPDEENPEEVTKNWEKGTTSLIDSTDRDTEKGVHTSA